MQNNNQQNLQQNLIEFISKLIKFNFQNHIYIEEELIEKLET